MSLVDSSTLWVNRLNALAPQIASFGYSQAYNYGLTMLSAYEDGQYLLNQNAANISVLSATGGALDLLGANAGIYRGVGTTAALLVQFSVQAPVTGTALVISAGTLVATPGDGIPIQQQVYATTAVTTISVGSTSSGVVLARAQTPGTLANVAAGNIVVMQTAISGVTVTNNPGGYTVPTSYVTPDAYGQILGTDRELDGPFRQRIISALVLNYGTNAITQAIQAVSMPELLVPLGDAISHNYSAYDSYVYDPQTGTGFVYYAWALADGSAPGLPGGTATATADGVVYINLSGHVLSDFALAVDTAVRAALPANTVPRIMAAGGITSPFNVIPVTSMAVKILVPPSVQVNTSTFADPASVVIKQAAVAYIQSLLHNQAPTVFGASQFAVQYCGQNNIPILGFYLTTVNGTNIVTSPLSAGTAVAPVLYRCTAAPSIVTLSIGYI